MAIVTRAFSRRGETLKVTRDVGKGTVLFEENACLHSEERRPDDRLVDLTIRYISRRLDVLDDTSVRENTVSAKNTETIKIHLSAADVVAKSDYVQTVYLKLLDRTKHVGHTALYRLGSLVNHSCAPTAVMIIRGQTLYIIALSDMNCFSEVTICYSGIDMSASTDVRRSQIARIYSFNCECTKCSPDVIDRFSTMRIKHHSAPALYNPFLDADH